VTATYVLGPMKRCRAILFMGACLLAVACGRGDAPSQNIRDPEPDKVSLRLQWFPLAQFAGFYVAADKGFYRDDRLDVTVNPGGPDFNAITLVANGSDQFGIWTADQILAARSRGVPITVVAAIYRKDPNVLMVRNGSGIKGPADFVGKTVTTVFGRATETVLRGMLARANVDPNRVRIEPFPFNVQSFVAGKVDVSAAYVYDHPFQARRMGTEVDLIDPADYGMNFYSDCLFVRTDLIEQRPDLVQRFVSATLRGWEYALAHQGEAVDIVMTKTQGIDRESQEYMLRESEALIRHENPDRLGLISLDSLNQMKAVLLEQKQLDHDIDVREAFTNRFVDAYYGR